MNSSPLPRPFRWRRFWFGLLATVVLVPVGLVGLLALLVFSSLHVGADVAALRGSVMPLSTTGPDKRVEVSLGRAALLSLRAGLHFAPLEPEARLALRALRSGELAVYRSPQSIEHADRATLLASADAAMERRGWDRAVGVLQKDEMVAIYVPRAMASAGELKVSALVLNQENLVVLSARVDAQPLMELLRERPEWRRPWR